MGRHNRVRQRTTDELVAEVSEFLIEGRLQGELTEQQQHRYERVCRELARRDYRFRSHGRKCTCEDCWMLYDAWIEWQRRSLDAIPDPPRGEW